MLLHDVGHYFMSHAAEYALEAHEESEARKVLPPKKGKVSSPTSFVYADHEVVGKLILQHDPELAPIIATLPHASPVESLAAMFKGATDEKYGSLVSSELDADRFDYLWRSSQATGLPYGHFDRDYLIEKLVTDRKGKVCLSPKAIRAADHFVLCRSFDYLQVIFHKTIVGFEEMLKRCVRYLVETKVLQLSEPDVVTLITSGTWKTLNDAYLMGLIREIPSNADPLVLAMRDRVIERKRAPLLWSNEAVMASPKKDSERDWYQRLGNYFETTLSGWKSNCLYWFKHFRPTDASPFQTTYKKELKASEAKEKSIHILGSRNVAKPLTDCTESITRRLSDQAYVMVRVYYVGPPADEMATRRDFKEFAKGLKLADGLH